MTGVSMLRQRRPLSSLRNQRGQALFETIPLLVVFLTLIGFGLGLYGAVQSAVLYSIAARTYSFETFRQRTNLYFFREDGSGVNPSQALNFSKKGWRYHAINNETDPRLRFVASTRSITFGTTAPPGDSTETTNNSSIYQLQARNQKISINPIWLMVGYGICLNMTCGGSGN